MTVPVVKSKVRDMDASCMSNLDRLVLRCRSVQAAQRGKWRSDGDPIATGTLLGADTSVKQFWTG